MPFDLTDPQLRGALIGSAVGAGGLGLLGYLNSDEKNRKRNTLLSGLAGAGLDGLTGHLYQQQHPPSVPELSPPQQQAVQAASLLGLGAGGALTGSGTSALSGAVASQPALSQELRAAAPPEITPSQLAAVQRLREQLPEGMPDVHTVPTIAGVGAGAASEAGLRTWLQQAARRAQVAYHKPTIGTLARNPMTGPTSLLPDTRAILSGATHPPRGPLSIPDLKPSIALPGHERDLLDRLLNPARFNSQAFPGTLNLPGVNATRSWPAALPPRFSGSQFLSNLTKSRWPGAALGGLGGYLLGEARSRRIIPQILQAHTAYQNNPQP
jgi:hypothetical protein